MNKKSNGLKGNFNGPLEIKICKSEVRPEDMIICFNPVTFNFSDAVTE